MINPGLMPAEFEELFAECNVCGLTMTQRTLEDHVCVLPDSDTKPEVVDLTEEDEEWI
jgi:hypothetical protein